MSTHGVSMIKNFNLKIKEEEEAISMEKQGIVSIDHHHHEQLIKDKPLRTFDIWSSILSTSKNEDSSNKLTPNTPYVHPLDKRSTSSLSEKSLEICTESLGSETGSGSDCFPSSPTSEREDSDNKKYNHHHHQQQHSVVSESSEDFRVYNHKKRLLSSCRSFPPSLPSIHMQSHRQNGRLVLEAASSPPKNSLHAQRLDGHLRITFINRNGTKLEMENRDDEVEVFDDIQEVEGNEIPLLDSGSTNEEEEEEENDEEEEAGTMMEQSPRTSSEMTNVNRVALMILEKKNQPTWSKCTTVSFNMTSGYFNLISRFNHSINTVVEQDKETSNIRECYTYPSPVPQILPLPREVSEETLAPPPPSSATATSLNAYEYFWRKKSKVANIVNCSTINKYYYNNKQVGLATTTKIATCTQDLVLIRGNNLLRSCKETRKYLIIWEPYCIAAS